RSLRLELLPLAGHPRAGQPDLEVVVQLEHVTDEMGAVVLAVVIEAARADRADVVALERIQTGRGDEDVADHRMGSSGWFEVESGSAFLSFGEDLRGARGPADGTGCRSLRFWVPSRSSWPPSPERFKEIWPVCAHAR